MFCAKCGVKLTATEKSCPLCNTIVLHSELQQPKERSLYPENNDQKNIPNTKALNEILLIFFLIPMVICLISDLRLDGEINWFGLAAGGIILVYVVFVLPLWFHKANPVIFVPCDFVMATLYLHYINYWTNGNWFMRFALPVSVGLGFITCTVITLNHYLQKGKLYIFGGGIIAYGLFVLLTEFLLVNTFAIYFVGWSLYPLTVLSLVGLLLIYLAINTSAKEALKRIFFI